MQGLRCPNYVIAKISYSFYDILVVSSLITLKTKKQTGDALHNFDILKIGNTIQKGGIQERDYPAICCDSCYITSYSYSPLPNISDGRNKTNI